MTNQQGAPEALRLADALDLYATGDEHQRDIEDAAAELRRLHYENERLAALVEAHQHARIAELDDALYSCLQLVNQLNEHHIPDGCSRLIRHIKDAAATVSKAQASAPADRQPAPEYVGNGMFKGETLEKAAEHWANWCDVRCMTGLSEFLRVVASRVQADSVLEDAARWQWLADYLIGERTDLDEGIVACATIDALRQFADAARKQGANHD